MTSRFDQIVFDEQAHDRRKLMRKVITDLESLIDTWIDSDREHELAMKSLEECWMWVGKGLRNDQRRRELAAAGPAPSERIP